MTPAMIEGASTVLGKSQGYLGLPVRIGISKEGIPLLTTAWTPTPKELEAMIYGASIYVTILGSIHPPIRLEVGPIPEREIEA